MKEGRTAFKILTGKPTGTRSLESPSKKYESLWKSLCECGIEPPDSIIHADS